MRQTLYPHASKKSRSLCSLPALHDRCAIRSGLYFWASHRITSGSMHVMQRLIVLMRT